MTQAAEEAYEAMQQVMAYCVATPSRGLLLAPEGQWSGCEDEELIIKGMSNTTNASDYDTRRSVMGRATFLNGAPIIVCSKMRQYVDLSVTESELGGATETAQDMLFAMCIIESMGLTVKKLMILYVDNKGAKDLANKIGVSADAQDMSKSVNTSCANSRNKTSSIVSGQVVLQCPVMS
jgi:hypothetical protein